MALFARTRPGTSASFWRHHNAMQTMMTEACMGPRAHIAPAVRNVHVPTAASAGRSQPPLPAWLPTPEQRARYQSRKVTATAHAQAN